MINGDRESYEEFKKYEERVVELNAIKGKHFMDLILNNVPISNLEKAVLRGEREIYYVRDLINYLNNKNNLIFNNVSSIYLYERYFDRLDDILKEHGKITKTAVLFKGILPQNFEEKATLIKKLQEAVFLHKRDVLDRLSSLIRNNENLDVEIIKRAVNLAIRGKNKSLVEAVITHLDHFNNEKKAELYNFIFEKLKDEENSLKKVLKGKYYVSPNIARETNDFISDARKLVAKSLLKSEFSVLEKAKHHLSDELKDYVEKEKQNQQVKKIVNFRGM